MDTFFFLKIMDTVGNLAFDKARRGAGEKVPANSRTGYSHTPTRRIQIKQLAEG